MNIIQRGARFVEGLEKLARRRAVDWRVCPRCGQTDTQKHGTYRSHPWFFDGRREVIVQRHKCNSCSQAGPTFTYSEESALLVRRGRYAREVRRLSVDLWCHGRTSLRRCAEFVRSVLGRQERWLFWRPLDQAPPAWQECHLGPSTVHRWLDGAGRVAQETVEGQLEGVASSGQVGTDGLWAKLRGKTKRVVLAVVDSVSGLIYPPVVAAGEEAEAAWEQMFARARLAGLTIEGLRGVTSDGAKGLLGYVGRALDWVNHQRCVFHLWRGLSGELARRAAASAEGLVGEAAKLARQVARQELVSLVRAVVDARSEAAAELALASLRAHRLGGGLAELVEAQLDTIQVYLSWYNQGLLRVGPEWVWRDFRLRLSQGRNHGSEIRLERASLVWGVYHNFTPAQGRSERKRHYRHPGHSSLEVAGAPPRRVCYLDALGV